MNAAKTAAQAITAATAHGFTLTNIIERHGIGCTYARLTRGDDTIVIRNLDEPVDRNVEVVLAFGTGADTHLYEVAYANDDDRIELVARALAANPA